MIQKTGKTELSYNFIVYWVSWCCNWI